MDLTQQAFAELVGRSHSYASKVVEGKRGPPDDLERWADSLSLEGSEREAFLEAGYLELTPNFIRERYLKLKGTGGTSN